jgi:hypothetical protein
MATEDEALTLTFDRTPPKPTFLDEHDITFFTFELSYQEGMWLMDRAEAAGTDVAEFIADTIRESIFLTPRPIHMDEIDEWEEEGILIQPKPKVDDICASCGGVNTLALLSCRDHDRSEGYGCTSCKATYPRYGMTPCDYWFEAGNWKRPVEVTE